MIFDISIYRGMEKSLAFGWENVKRGGTYTDDMRSASLGSKHSKDPSAAPDIQHGLVLEEMRIA